MKMGEDSQSQDMAAMHANPEFAGRLHRCLEETEDRGCMVLCSHVLVAEGFEGA